MAGGKSKASEGCVSAAGMADAVGNTGALITKADLVLTENGKLESDVSAIMSTNRDGCQFLLKNKAGICARLRDVTGPLSPPMSLTSARRHRTGRG